MVISERVDDMSVDEILPCRNQAAAAAGPVRNPDRTDPDRLVRSIS